MDDDAGVTARLAGALLQLAIEFGVAGGGARRAWSGPDHRRKRRQNRAESKKASMHFSQGPGATARRLADLQSVCLNIGIPRRKYKACQATDLPAVLEGAPRAGFWTGFHGLCRIGTVIAKLAPKSFQI
jgi:hypothetical protein